MNKIKFPHPIKLTVAALSSFWIADIINSSFNSIGIMILLLIPTLLIDLLYPQEDALKKQIPHHKQSAVNISNSEEEVTDGSAAPEAAN